MVKFFNNYLDIADTSDASGLEVAIAREILEKHGGSLKIEETEKGILFTATLVRHEIPNAQGEKDSS
jgi:K+-sensing histidine kinase KdpD